MEKFVWNINFNVIYTTIIYNLAKDLDNSIFFYIIWTVDDEKYIYHI